MKINLGLFAFLLGLATMAEAQTKLPTPTPVEAQWLNDGIGIFVHWAPNVYQGGEGDRRTTPPEKINPDQFDAAKIVAAAKSANAGYIIFVAKHVGGYCCWQTETTDYSLKSSPWREGKGDMVGDLAEACQKDGMRFGVYLSPRSDVHGVTNGGRAAASKQDEYNEIYRKQLTELLTKYGPMFEMWFDGGNVVPVNDLIDKLAPDIITFQGRRLKSTRWISNEHGFASYPCWSTIDWKEGLLPGKGTGSPTGNTWCPAECDVSILRPNWFWKQGSDARVLSLDNLMEIYYLSVGRGVNLLLNIAPDDHGAVPEAQVRRLKEFGDEVKARFDKPLASTQGEGDELLLDLGGERPIDHFRLAEDIRQGERVRKFVIEGRRPDLSWITLFQGSHVGVRQIVPVPTISVTALRVKVLESAAPVKIKDFSAFYVNRTIPKTAYRDGAKPSSLREPNFGRSSDGHFHIDSSSPDWEIRYTLDGTEPTQKSELYSEPQPLAEGGTLKARYFVTATGEAGPVATRRFGLAISEFAVVKASGAANPHSAKKAFDGDPKTMWHTPYGKNENQKPPHEVVLDLEKVRSVAGLTYLPRQDFLTGCRPKSVKVWVSDSADNFPAKAAVEYVFDDAKTISRDGFKYQSIVPFDTAVKGRYVKIQFPETIDTPYMAAAEVEVLVEKTKDIK